MWYGGLFLLATVNNCLSVQLPADLLASLNNNRTHIKAAVNPPRARAQHTFGGVQVCHRARED